MINTPACLARGTDLKIVLASDAEPSSSPPDLSSIPAVPAAPASTPQRYQPISARRQRSDDDGNISVTTSELEELKKNVTSARSSMDSTEKSVEAAKASLDSSRTSLNAVDQWLNKTLGDHTTSAPATFDNPIETSATGYPSLVTLPAVEDDHPGKALTNADRQAMLSKELANLLGQEGKITPAVPSPPVLIPPIGTSMEREPVLSPTPSSADGTSPGTRLRELAASLADSQRTNQMLPQSVTAPAINPAPQTPPASLPSQLTQSTMPLTPPPALPLPSANPTPPAPPVIGTMPAAPPAVGPTPAATPPAVGPTPAATPPIGTAPRDLSNLLSRISNPEAAATPAPLAAPAPLTEANVRRLNGTPDGAAGSREEDLNTVKSGDSTGSSVFSKASDQSANSVATSVGSGRGAK